jgi:hypothetical protein
VDTFDVPPAAFLGACTELVTELDKLTGSPRIHVGGLARVGRLPSTPLPTASLHLLFAFHNLKHRGGCGLAQRHQDGEEVWGASPINHTSGAPPEAKLPEPCGPPDGWQLVAMRGNFAGFFIGRPRTTIENQA